MGNYIKGAWLALKDYILLEIVFCLLLLPIIKFGKDNLGSWIFVYSIIFFIIQMLIIYSDFHRLGIKEEKPQYNLQPYPLKGFVYGIISLIPYGVLGLVSLLLTFQDPIAERAKHLLINTLIGPVYWIAKLGNETPTGYIISVLSLSMICGLSYLGGNIGLYFNKNNKPGAIINKNKNKRRE